MTKKTLAITLAVGAVAAVGVGAYFVFRKPDYSGGVAYVQQQSVNPLANLINAVANVWSDASVGNTAKTAQADMAAATPAVSLNASNYALGVSKLSGLGGCQGRNNVGYCGWNWRG